VVVAIGADRRGPAQRCCQELLEALKHDAPFWKREWRTDGTGTWLTVQHAPLNQNTGKRSSCAHSSVPASSDPELRRNLQQKVCPLQRTDA